MLSAMKGQPVKDLISILPLTQLKELIFNSIKCGFLLLMKKMDTKTINHIQIAYFASLLHYMKSETYRNK